MNAKVMKDIVDSDIAKIKTVEVGSLAVNQAKTITFDFLVNLFVVNGTLYSSLTNFVSATFMQTGYFYTQNANRMFVQVEHLTSTSEITLKALENWYAVSVIGIG